MNIKFSDIGTIDEDGYLRICSRIKEMIIRGGENIYPREIEEFILTHPTIADVHVCLYCLFLIICHLYLQIQYSKVVGVPDHRMGEEMCAFIRLKSDQTNMKEKDIKTLFKDEVIKEILQI